MAPTLVLADLFVVAVVWLAMVGSPMGRRWAILSAAIGAATCFQAAGHAAGLYDVSSPARVQRGCLTVLGFGVLTAAFAALLTHGLGNPVPTLRILVWGGTAVVFLVLIRLIVAVWAGEMAAELAERVVLVGLPSTIGQLLSSSWAPGSANQRATLAGTGLSTSPLRPWSDRQPGSCYASVHVAGWISLGSADVMLASEPEQAPCARSWASSIEPLGELHLEAETASTIAQDCCQISNEFRRLCLRVDRLVIVPTGIHDATVSAALVRLQHLPFEIALAPASSLAHEFDDPLDRKNCLVLRQAPITHWGSLAKRGIDVAAALLMLLAFSPFLVIIAALVWYGSPGPVLFRQTRWGLNNAPFTVFKFRTMWCDAAAPDGSVQATRRDRRVTPIGAFLRRTSLDELPQLLNVLNGTMSLVGPRPHPVELNRRYLGVIARYVERHRVTPGITGLAQVNGMRGEIVSQAAMQSRIDYDLEYIRNRSLGTDLRILLKTVSSVIQGQNAY